MRVCVHVHVWKGDTSKGGVELFLKAMPIGVQVDP